MHPPFGKDQLHTYILHDCFSQLTHTYIHVCRWLHCTVFLRHRLGAKRHEYDAIGHCGMVLEMAGLAGNDSTKIHYGTNTYVVS